MNLIAIVLALAIVGIAKAQEAISVTLDNTNNLLTITATVSTASLKAEYAAKKAATGKTDAELKSYRDVLILDAVRDAILRARAAAEQTDLERAAELAAQKARLDAEYAKRAALKPTITVSP
jgi:hypothetical protein